MVVLTSCCSSSSGSNRCFPKLGYSKTIGFLIKNDHDLKLWMILGCSIYRDLHSVHIHISSVADTYQISYYTPSNIPIKSHQYRSSQLLIPSSIPNFSKIIMCLSLTLFLIKVKSPWKSPFSLHFSKIFPTLPQKNRSLRISENCFKAARSSSDIFTASSFRASWRSS